MDKKEYYSKCPCINCICVPVCRHKDYYKLRQECELAMDYTQHKDMNIHRYCCRVLEVVLKPTIWQLGKSIGEEGYHIKTKDVEQFNDKFEVFKEVNL